MGLIESELAEIRKLMNDFRQGNVKLENYKALIAGYKETHNRVNSILKAMALVGQYGEVAEQYLRVAKLIGNEKTKNQGGD